MVNDTIQILERPKSLLVGDDSEGFSLKRKPGLRRKKKQKNNNNNLPQLNLTQSNKIAKINKADATSRSPVSADSICH